MEDRVADVTVRVTLADTPPAFALIVTAPVETEAAKPSLFIVATDGLEELQETCLVMKKLVPSEYVPRTVNCWVSPTGLLGKVALSGVRAMDEIVAALTVRGMLPDALPKAAVMVAAPVATDVSRPLPLTTATPASEEPQVTSAVISKLVPLG